MLLKGKNHWRFESAKDTSRFDAFEGSIFWASLILAPAAWLLFVTTAFLTFKWEWAMIAALGAVCKLRAEKTSKRQRRSANFQSHFPTCTAIFDVAGARLLK